LHRSDAQIRWERGGRLDLRYSTGMRKYFIPPAILVKLAED